MLGRTTRKSAASLLVALATLLAAPASQATVWYGSWDPAFGSPFTSIDPLGYNLGWGGGQAGTFINVQLDAPCGSLPVGLKENSADCSGNAVVQSAKVGLYNVGPNTPPALLPTFLETLDFNPSSPTPPPAPYLTIDHLLYGPNSKLTAINTTLSDWVLDTGAGTGYEFALQFIIKPADCASCEPLYLAPFFPELTDYTGPVLFARTALTDFESQLCSGDTPINFACVGDFKVYRANVIDFPAVATYVPEPATLALVAGSLLALGASTRRRRATSS